MKRLAVFIAIGALIMPVGATEAQPDPKEERAALADEIVQLLAERDSFVAIRRIESGEDAKAIGQRFFYLVIDLYSEKKVDEMITVGRFGIHYLLTQSREHEGRDQESAEWFESLAQMTSFNLASNLWPGWGDEGIVITAEQQAFGFEMARLDLRLVEEMELPASKLSTATWVVGIHHVAAGRYAEGKRVLAKAREYAEASGTPETPLMVDGYVAIAEILEGENVEGGRAKLAATKEALEALGSEDAEYYAKQHEEVLEVLMRR